jgi:hypothetical protein
MRARAVLAWSGPAPPDRATSAPAGVESRFREVRVGVSATLTCVVFLCTYSALRLLHALHLAPPLLRYLSGIPMFANVLASAATASAAGIAMAFFDNCARLIPALSKALILAIGLFAVTALLLP